MSNLSDQLNATPKGRQLLENQAAIQQMLSSPEAQKVLKKLQKKDTSQLQSAAQAALKGDTAALNGLLNDLSSDPEAKKAIEHLNQTLK